MKLLTAIPFLGLTLITGSLLAQSSDHARILNLGAVPFTSTSAIAVPAGNTAIAIPLTSSGTDWLLTVRIDDIAYSFYPWQTRKVHYRDFIVGDDIRARVEKDSVYGTLADGRETHGRLLRRERLQPQNATVAVLPAP